jgi:phosphatidylserine/phosphatidylglycerophosphate/cardiolipin synthase-like enzyme
MRRRGHNDAITVTLIAGSEVVLIGLDIAPEHRVGLLGFTIWRRGAADAEFEPLIGGRRFKAVAPPSQGDYVVDPGTEYVYRVAAGYGEAGRLEHRHAIEVAVRTEHPDEGRHGVYFNRGVAGSQGYMRRFGEHARFYRVEEYGRKAWRRFVRPHDVPNREALAWLSRGLGEALEAFVRRATHGEGEPAPKRALRAAVYEFTDPSTLRAFVDVLESGADVKVVHHAAQVTSRTLNRNPDASVTVDYRDESRDPVTYRNSEVRQESRPDQICADAVAALDRIGVKGEESQRAFEQMLIPRTRASIQHNKFIILLEDGVPTEVWTGSTNLTEGGIYGQSNVGQVIRDRSIAQQYLDYWERLAEDPALRASGAAPGFAEWNALQYPDPDLPRPGEVLALFSPRPTERLLEWYAELFGSARQSVHFTTAFTVAEPFLQRAVQSPANGALRYLLMESVGGRLREPYERMRQIQENRIAWGDRVGAGVTAEAGETQLQLEEALTGLNEHVSYMHTKYMLVDPLTDDPIVVSGSANFSRASTLSNDENMLVYRGDLRVADMFLTEFMRLFRHFESRNRRNLLTPAELADFQFLAENDSWSASAFAAGSAEESERLLLTQAHVPQD